jgi:hypothetical protein
VPNDETIFTNWQDAYYAGWRWATVEFLDDQGVRRKGVVIATEEPSNCLVIRPLVAADGPKLYRRDRSEILKFNDPKSPARQANWILRRHIDNSHTTIVAEAAE